MYRIYKRHWKKENLNVFIKLDPAQTLYVGFILFVIKNRIYGFEKRRNYLYKGH